MRIRTADAFTDRAYTGNPAGVVLFESGPFPADTRLQNLAAELNLAETAYAHPLPGDAHEGTGADADEGPGASAGADWALRWFTPAAEVDLCGHATLATAHVLAEDGLVPDAGAVRFHTRSGVLGTVVAADGTITLDFPTAPLTEVPPPAGLATALRAEPVAVHDTGPLGDLLVELRDESTVRELAPDTAALGRLPHRGVIVTAEADDPGAGGYAYVSRMFAPSVGIPEDPVTGSAHTALAPLWSKRLGALTLTGLQASARTGLVRTTLRGERTELAGTAVTVLDAELRAGL
jgi:PhzF family phenazine biosynthesis protein